MIPRIIVVIPVFNNAGTIEEVIAGARRFVDDVLVVDDGSTDGTAQRLSQCHDCATLTFEKNRGKGAALRAAFEMAFSDGFTHAITLDADGQHVTGDIALFLEAIRKDPAALWVGNRVFRAEGGEPPPRSRFGRRFGNFWYRFNTGIRLGDTQCGFRTYPLRRMLDLAPRGNRYEFEQDALIKAAWNGVPVKEIDIHQCYPPHAKRASHFRPVRDFLRISAVNSRAGFVRVAFPVLTFDAPGRTWLEKIRWLVKEELHAHATPKRAAFSVALGVFMGIFPIHGLQVVSLLGLSMVLRLNRPLALLGVCISSPPMLPFLIVAAVAVGRLVVPQGWVSHASASPGQMILQGGIEFIVGSCILAVILSIAAYIVLYPVFVRLHKSGILGKKA